MKVFIDLAKFFVSVILAIFFVIMFDIYNLFQWVENKLVDKFVLHFVLSEDAIVDDVLEALKTGFKKLKLKEVSYITKQQIFDEVRQKEELAVVLNVLKQNPFSDVIKVKIENYSKKEFENLVEAMNLKSCVKQSLFDYNIKSYLDRIEELKPVVDLVYKIVFIFVVLTIVFYLFNIKNLKTNFAAMVMFSVVYFVIVLVNKKFVNLITMFELIKFDLFTVFVFVIIYLFCVLQNFEVVGKNFLFKHRDDY